MESNKQSQQITVSQVISYLQSSISKFNRIHLTQSSFPEASRFVLACSMVVAVSVCGAVLPVHAEQNFTDPARPGISQARNNNKTEKWVRGRILIMPRAGLPKNALDEILKEHDGKARKIGQSDLYIVDLPEFSEEGVVAKLQHHPHLKFAELDRIFPPVLIPNDPYYNQLGDAWHLSKIGAPIAWDIAQGTGVIIAILDSGVDSTQLDLATNMVSGWNFYDNNSITFDVFGHGTSVAGVAAATTNNGIGVAGIAGQSNIMPIRVTDGNGFAFSSTIVQGLTWASDRGVRVANISFESIASSLSVKNAAQYMKDKGGLVTVSAGNTGLEDAISPTTSLIPVSATDSNDVKTSWSTYGNFVAISAPGTRIWTTKINGIYDTSAGTSFSSPLGAGVISLMMSANPKLSSTEIESLLFSTVVDLGAAGRDPYYGYGRVDAAAAVQAAKNAIPVQDTEAPALSIIDPLGGAVVSGLVPVDIQVTDNVGVTRAELWINNTSVAVDTSAPFAFTWDSSGVQNGTASLAVRAYDAANNMVASSIAVSVGNPVQIPVIDIQAPAVKIVNPVAGSVSGSVNISINASDNNDASGILLSIYIDGVLKASGTGSTLGTNWNTRSKGVRTGTHTIQAVAKDAAGNTSTSSVTVNVIK